MHKPGPDAFVLKGTLLQQNPGQGGEQSFDNMIQPLIRLCGTQDPETAV
jgi:hypothetical protein